jgi:hypothetical protein
MTNKKKGLEESQVSEEAVLLVGVLMLFGLFLGSAVCALYDCHLDRNLPRQHQSEPQ